VDTTCRLFPEIEISISRFYLVCLISRHRLDAAEARIRFEINAMLKAVHFSGTKRIRARIPHQEDESSGIVGIGASL